MTEPATPTAWCGTCRRYEEVMDTYLTDTGDRTDPTVTYLARPLACGHDAGDGGAPPRKTTPPADRQALVDRVAALQERSS